jgi:hypothetical protein
MDLVPEIKVIVYREGEANPVEEAAPAVPAEVAVPAAETAAEA